MIAKRIYSFLILIFIFFISFIEIKAFSNELVQPSKLKKYTSDTAKANVQFSSSLIDSVIQKANQCLGLPHCMGGTGEKCIDCSGLISKAFLSIGLALPHEGEGMAYFGKMIPPEDSLQKGDLLFFTNSYRTRNFITHVGLYLGEGNFIHASAIKGVEVVNLYSAKYWKERYVFAKRVFVDKPVKKHKKSN